MSDYFIKKLNSINHKIINLFSIGYIIRLYLYKFIDKITGCTDSDPLMELSTEINVMIDFLGTFNMKTLYNKSIKYSDSKDHLNTKRLYNAILFHIKILSYTSLCYKKMNKIILTSHVNMIKINGKILRSIMMIENNKELEIIYNTIDNINNVLIDTISILRNNSH
jgi:hypothetical protein